MKNAKEPNQISKYRGVYYTSPFATILRNLLSQKEFNQEKIAKELNVTRQTISLYANGNSLPDINKFEQIITFFKNNGYDYSSDYWLGLISEKSTDIDTKAINKQYGLSGKSLSALELLTNQKNAFNFPTIEALNSLLEDILVEKQNSLICAITDYLFLSNKEETIKLNISSIKGLGVSSVLSVEKTILIKSILLREIEYMLEKLRKKINEEGEKNECKRTRKK
jgi:DNA-binding XRE family transcriptional regulator